MLRKSLLVTVLMSLSACAPIGSMLPGTIYSQNGKMMPLQIAVSTGSGAVTASDPATGERFSGTYVGIIERTTGAASAFGPAGFGVATGSVGSNIASSTAYLSGDKGTMLTCEMQIAAGLSPHGIGSCTDNKNMKYRLQF
jgi:hypothetical protein